jgi:hypothetical protein
MTPSPAASSPHGAHTRRPPASAGSAATDHQGTPREVPSSRTTPTVSPPRPPGRTAGHSAPAYDRTACQCQEAALRGPCFTSNQSNDTAPSRMGAYGCHHIAKARQCTPGVWPTARAADLKAASTRNMRTATGQHRIWRCEADAVSDPSVASATQPAWDMKPTRGAPTTSTRWRDARVLARLTFATRDELIAQTDDRLALGDS